jgi:hypothetical protein
MGFEGSGGDTKQFGPKAEADAPGLFDAFNEASEPVSEADRLGRALIAKLLELGRGGDPAQSVGYRGAGNPKGAERKIIIQRKQHEDDMRFAMRIVTMELDQLVADLDARLAEIDNKLKEIDQRLSAVDELEALYDSGKLDPNNPAHRALMEKAGIKPEDWEKDPALALTLARRHWDEERDYWKRQRDDVVQKRDEAEHLRERAENAATPQEAQDVAEDFAKLREKGGAVIADKATTDLDDKNKVRTIEAAVGFDDAEQDRAVAAKDGQSVYSKTLDYGAPPQTKIAP